MHKGKNVFAQLLDFIDKDVFLRHEQEQATSIFKCGSDKCTCLALFDRA